MNTLDELKSNSMTGKDAPTLMDGVNKANEKLDDIKSTLEKSGNSVRLVNGDASTDSEIKK